MRPLHVCTLSFLCCLVVGCGSDSSARPDPAPDIVQPVLEFARRVRERMLRNEQSVPVLVLSCSVVGHSAAKNFYKLDMPAGVATCFGHSLSPSSKDHQGTLTVDDDYYRLVFDGPTADGWVPLTQYANDPLGRMETQINRHTGMYWTKFHLPGRRGRATENAGSVGTGSGRCTREVPPF